jgi:hypothetical protein
MNPITRLLGHLADRLHPNADLTAALAGLTVIYRPDGTRVVRHPDMPSIAAAYRARVLADPDPLDRLFIDRAVLAQAHHEAATRRARTGVTR